MLHSRKIMKSCSCLTVGTVLVGSLVNPPSHHCGVWSFLKSKEKWRPNIKYCYIFAVWLNTQLLLFKGCKKKKKFQISKEKL